MFPIKWSVLTNIHYAGPLFLILFSLVVFTIMPFLGIYMDVEVGDTTSLILIFSGISGMSGFASGFIASYWIFLARQKVTRNDDNVIELEEEY